VRRVGGAEGVKVDVAGSSKSDSDVTGADNTEEGYATNYTCSSSNICHFHACFSSILVVYIP